MAHAKRVLSEIQKFRSARNFWLSSMTTTLGSRLSASSETSLSRQPHLARQYQRRRHQQRASRQQQSKVGAAHLRRQDLPRGGRAGAAQEPAEASAGQRCSA